MTRRNGARAYRRAIRHLLNADEVPRDAANGERQAGEHLDVVNSRGEATELPGRNCGRAREERATCEDGSQNGC